MGVTATSKSKERVNPPPGLAKARCIWVIDLGTQETTWQNQKKLTHQIRLTFELLETKHVFDEAKGPQPFVLSRTFTVSVATKSKTRPFIEQFLGRSLTPAEEKDGFDFSNFLNKPCMVNVIHEADKKDASIKYANIASISPPMKGSGAYPAAVNPLIDYAIGSKNQWTEFEKIYSHLQDKIKLAPEWQSEAAKAGYGKTAPATTAATDEVDEPSEDEF